MYQEAEEEFLGRLKKRFALRRGFWEQEIRLFGRNFTLLEGSKGYKSVSIIVEKTLLFLKFGTRMKNLNYLILCSYFSAEI